MQSSLQSSYSSTKIRFKLKALCLLSAVFFFGQGPFEMEGLSFFVNKVRFPMV